MKKVANLFIVSVLLYTLAQCKKEKSPISNPKVEQSKQDSLMREEARKLKDSIRKADSIRIENEKIKYSEFVFPKNNRDSAMGAFLEKFSKEERYTILAINRLDDKNKWRADTLVIPNHLDVDFIKYAPYPMFVEALQKVDKMAFFSYTNHAYGIYENGNLIKWGPTSMGKKATSTLTGLQFTNWKKELAISTSNSSWKLRWNFNVHNRLGFGWHQYDLPGFHASHSCMRLLEKDAEWLYHWADQWTLTNQGRTVLAKGTPVMVFGETDFKTRPWLGLIDNPKADHYTTEQMNALVNPVLNTILKEQTNSQQYRKTKQETTD